MYKKLPKLSAQVVVQAHNSLLGLQVHYKTCGIIYPHLAAIHNQKLNKTTRCFLGLRHQHSVGLADLREGQGDGGELRDVVAHQLEACLLDLLCVLELQLDQLVPEDLERVQDRVALFRLMQGA